MEVNKTEKNFDVTQWRERSAEPVNQSIVFRELHIDATRANNEQRTVEASLSSELPVLRGYGYEVLSHENDAVNLGRAVDGELPLLFGHNHDDVIGKVENVRLYSGRLRGRLKFSKSKRGDEIWQDVKDGILKYISIGYTIEKREVLNECYEPEATHKVLRWCPHEVSCVGVPADHSVGIGRKLEAGALYKGSSEANSLEKRNELAAIYKTYHDQIESGGALDEARELCAEIEADPSRSATELNQLILRTMDSSKPTEAVAPKGADFNNQLSKGNAMNDKPDFSKFSITRALLALSGDRTIDAGYELEVHQELARNLGRSTSGLLIPLGSMKRDLTAGGSGGNMVATEHLGSEFINVLRARSQVMQMGPTVLNDLVGNVTIPRKTASATAGWYDLDGTDTITESDPTLDQVSLSMKSVAGLATFSHKMLKQGSPDVENMVREDLAGTIGAAIDLAAIQGTGAGNQPTGIVNQTGINASTYPLGATPSFSDIVNMEGLIAADNVDLSSLAYVTTPTLSTTLKTAEKSSGTAQYVWDSMANGEGRMNGFKAVHSSNVPAKHVILGNWRDLIIGHWGTLELSADGGGANFAKGSVSVRAVMDMDVAVRHPESFCVMSEALV